MEIQLTTLAWEDISRDEEKPGSRLLATLTFDGVGHHLEAIQVENRNGAQCTVDPGWDDMLDNYYEATGADGPFSTVQINGRSYVLVMTPFCA